VIYTENNVIPIVHILYYCSCH